MRNRLAILSLLLVTACASDASGPQVTTLSGRWTYNATNVAGGGIACDIGNVTMNLNQVGSTFSGTVLGGTISCRANGITFLNESLGDDVVLNGQTSGNAVSFDIGTTDLHNTGTLSGNSMSGQLSIRINTGTQVVVLVGNFAAVQQ
jgi:hypothetical protein